MFKCLSLISGLAIEFSCFTIVIGCILDRLVSIVTVINVDKPVVLRGVVVDRALLAVIRPSPQDLAAFTCGSFGASPAHNNRRL